MKPTFVRTAIVVIADALRRLRTLGRGVWPLQMFVSLEQRNDPIDEDPHLAAEVVAARGRLCHRGGGCLAGAWPRARIDVTPHRRSAPIWLPPIERACARNQRRSACACPTVWIHCPSPVGDRDDAPSGSSEAVMRTPASIFAMFTNQQCEMSGFSIRPAVANFI